MSGGSLLYSLGAAELKAHNPILEENRGSWSGIPDVARWVSMPSPGCIICNSSLKYGGWPVIKAWCVKTNNLNTILAFIGN